MGQIFPPGSSWIFPLCNRSVNLPGAVPWRRQPELPPPTPMHTQAHTPWRASLSNALTCRAENLSTHRGVLPKHHPFSVRPQSPACLCWLAGLSHGESHFTGSWPIVQGGDRLFKGQGLHRPGFGGTACWDLSASPGRPVLQAGRSNPAFSHPNNYPSEEKNKNKQTTLL